MLNNPITTMMIISRVDKSFGLLPEVSNSEKKKKLIGFDTNVIMRIYSIYFTFLNYTGQILFYRLISFWTI